MSLFDRLLRTEEPFIPAHYWFAALEGYASLQVTRAELEALFNISTEDPDASELDYFLNGIADAQDTNRFLNGVHSVFMHNENPGVQLTKQDVINWLAADKTSWD